MSSKESLNLITTSGGPPSASTSTSASSCSSSSSLSTPVPKTPTVSVTSPTVGSPLPILANGRVSTYQSLDALLATATSGAASSSVTGAITPQQALATSAVQSSSSYSSSSSSQRPSSASQSSTNGELEASDDPLLCNDDQLHECDLYGITVKLISASDLMVADMFSRSSDPYVKLIIDGVERRSRIIKKTLNPQWRETFNWIFKTPPKELLLQVYDWDAIGLHDPLGSKLINLDSIGVNDGLTYEGDLRLEGKGVKSGHIKLSIESSTIPNMVGRSSSSSSMSGVDSIEDIVSLVELKVVGGEKLGTKTDHLLKLKTDPYATVSFGLHQFRTAMVPSNNNPVWNQLCPLWITESDHNSHASIKISVWDYERLGNAILLGHAYIHPHKLRTNHLYDIKLPLTTDAAETDAQLSVLMQDLGVKHETSATSELDAENESEADSAHDHPTEPSRDHGRGFVHVHIQIKPREQVEAAFYQQLIQDYDMDGSQSMDLTEMTHALTTIGVKLSPDELAEAFDQVAKARGGSETGADIGLKADELGVLFRTKIFESKAVLKQLYAVILYGVDALDTLLMKGCLTAPNMKMDSSVTNAALTESLNTVDNDGTQIMVQDRMTGMIVRESIPAYIKSALVLLNRTWMGKLAANRIKGTIKRLTIRQGKKMDDPKSKADIPNFVRIHRLNLNEVEKPLEEYRTFNEFFYRRLKPGVRTCFAPDDNSIAVSPADCRMMCFQSIEESQRLWIKGKHFTIGNLFGAWDPDGKMATKFNGGQLCIARLAPQDYHRFHWPVSGKVQKRFLIPGAYHTVNPIAVRKHVDVYTENKRCICPIETKEFGLVLLIAISATMVGSIGFDCTCASRPSDGSVCCPDGKCMVGREVHKFDDCGWFAFGGSTTLVLFQPGAIQFDIDLVKNSEQQLETLVRVGMSLGKATGQGTR